MSWHFSQALEAAFLEGSSVDSAPCAPLNTTPTHGTFWSPGKTMDPSNPSRSGMMYAHSTDAHGKALLMSCLGGFRVRISRSPAVVKELKGREADYGKRWPESFVKWDQDSSLWKTRQCSLLAGLDEFSETWPRWGMMRDGECWQQDTPEHLTCENESGFWPTLAKMDSQNCHPYQSEISNGIRLTTISSNGKRGTSPLRSWLAAFPDRSCKGTAHWADQPTVGRMVHGMADGVDQIAAIGNGQVPAVVRLAWHYLQMPAPQH